jgi:transcriptional regulator with XRE-family HTH domain
MPSVRRLLAELGENLRLARLRRRFSMELVAERAGMSRATLRAVERGEPAVTLGSYANVLHVLGLHGDIALLARDDLLGRKLQDAGLPARRRAPKRPKPEAVPSGETPAAMPGVRAPRRGAAP